MTVSYRQHADVPQKSSNMKHIVKIALFGALLATWAAATDCAAGTQLDRDKEAAKRGDMKAMDRVMSYYIEGGPSSSAERMEWCTFAAKNGSAFGAQFCATEMLHAGNCKGAEAWFRRSSAMGKPGIQRANRAWIISIHLQKYRCK
jgi:hypothetical protein